jgi:hypothetical protein
MFQYKIKYNSTQLCVHKIHVNPLPSVLFRFYDSITNLSLNRSTIFGLGTFNTDLCVCQILATGSQILMAKITP